MKKKNVKETLADRIAGVLSAAPSSFDPEEDTNEETSAKVIETEQPDDSEEDEVLLSKFRKQNVELLEDVDQRYAGRKGSRRNLKDSESEDDLSNAGDNLSGDDDISDEGDSSDDDFEEKYGKLSVDDGDTNKVKKCKAKNQTDDEDDIDDDKIDEEEDSEEEMDEEDDDNEFNSESEDETNFKHLKNSDPSGQLKKGACIKNQLNLWETLLEMRIQLQKCLITSNKMPQFNTYTTFNEIPEFQKKASETKKSVGSILDKLLELQNLMIRKYPETKNLLKEGNAGKKKTADDDDEEIPSDTDEELNANESEDDEEIASPKKKLKLSEYEHVINEMHGKYKPFRNLIIQKWNDKTRIATGKSTTAHSVINQIEHNLRDRDRLMKRTQIKRSEYKIIGVKESEPVDPENAPRFVEETNNEIYDDDDFYHQLLRELIEVKSADLTDPVQLGRQWIQLQNLRSKMKRKIDTKATKGRKIRYAVHTKLVNFMAPIDGNNYTDEAKTELFNSLFGKTQAVNG